MNRPKLKKGDRVFVFRRAERHRPEMKAEGIVMGCGPKYFYVGIDGDDVGRYPHMKVRCYTETWRECVEYGNANHQVYASQQEYDDEKERDSLKDFIRTKFTLWGYNSFTLDTLRQIKVILDQADAHTKP